MEAIPVILIFDVGKTNKKIFLFDEDYKIVYENIIQIPETTDEDGDACEDVEQLKQWIFDSVNNLFEDKRFQIKAINFSAYGATFVHLNEGGKVITPIYNYLKPYPEDFKKKFYKTYGGEEEFCQATASPSLGSLNSGMVLYRLKYEKSELFKSIKYALHLPHYLSFLITRKPCSELTSIGCHTFLWDFERQNYHDWLYKEGVAEKLAPIFSSNKVMEVATLGKPSFIGVGLHDSSAALIPYLKSFQEPFVLISTGTWCISLNPFNQEPLTSQELKQDCLCYLSYEGKPIKSSRLFAGHQHDVKVKELAERFQVDLEYYKTVKFENSIINAPTYEVAYHQLMLDIISQQKKSIELVLTPNVKQIFVDGGFSKNEIYMRLLAEAFPKIKVFAARVSQASALGAAMVIHESWNAKEFPENLVEILF